MPTSTITVRLDPELVALLTEIRDRLPERESRITCMDCGIDLNPGDPLDCAKHAPADLEWLAEPVPVPHPDEALAKVLHDADSNGHFSWEGTGLEARADYLRMARAAREHIEAEPDQALRFIHPDAYDRERKWHGQQRVRAEKAEADLARVTEERDDWRTKAQRIWNETHSWLATIEPADGGSMKVTRRRRGALIDIIDGLWWSDDARAEGQS